MTRKELTDSGSLPTFICLPKCITWTFLLQLNILKWILAKQFWRYCSRWILTVMFNVQTILPHFSTWWFHSFSNHCTLFRKCSFNCICIAWNEFFVRKESKERNNRIKEISNSNGIECSMTDSEMHGKLANIIRLFSTHSQVNIVTLPLQTFAQIFQWRYRQSLTEQSFNIELENKLVWIIVWVEIVLTEEDIKDENVPWLTGISSIWFRSKAKLSSDDRSISIHTITILT